MAGPVVALEAVGRALGHDPGREAGRIELAGRGREQHVDAVLGREAAVALDVAWVGGKVVGIGELRRIDEEARDDDVALGPRCPEQRRVALVQGAHRRDEADAASLAQRRERLAQLGDRLEGLHFEAPAPHGCRARQAYPMPSDSKPKIRVG